MHQARINSLHIIRRRIDPFGKRTDTPHELYSIVGINFLILILNAIHYGYRHGGVVPYCQDQDFVICQQPFFHGFPEPDSVKLLTI